MRTSSQSDRPLRREERRARFLDEARERTPYVAVRLGGLLFFVRTDDRGLGRAIFIKGWRKDLATLAEALTTLAEHDVRLPDRPAFVDVGANIGTTIVTALVRHGFASGVAIEPAPLNYRTLKVNLAANGLIDRARPIEAAVSDADGHATFDVSQGNFGGHRVTDADSGTTVRTVSLDDLADDGLIESERVGMLWVDAVGHEGPVLAGATRLLEAGAPVVMSRRRDLGLGPYRERVLELVTANYTDVVELRDFLTRHPIDEFGDIVDSFRHSTDLLLIRRPGR